MVNPGREGVGAWKNEKQETGFGISALGIFGYAKRGRGGEETA